MTDQNNLQRHIDKVLEFKNSDKGEKLSLEELKELDLSMGMTENEWEQMMKEAKNNVELSKKHLSVGNFSDAIIVAQNSVSVNPYLSDAYKVLALAYMKEWTDSNNPESLQNAEINARECIALSPSDKEALSILARCTNELKQNSSNKNQMKKILIIGAVVLGAIILYFTFSGNSSQKNEYIRLEEQMISARSQLVNVIDRRNSLITNFLSLVKDGNSVDLLKTIQSDKDKCTQSTPGSEEYFTCQKQLGSQLTMLSKEIVGEGTVKDLIIQLEGAENRISVERKRYNDAVKNYNIFIKMNQDDFPDAKEVAYAQ